MLIMLRLFTLFHSLSVIANANHVDTVQSGDIIALKNKCMDQWLRGYSRESAPTRRLRLTSNPGNVIQSWQDHRSVRFQIVAKNRSKRQGIHYGDPIALGYREVQTNRHWINCKGESESLCRTKLSPGHSFRFLKEDAIFQIRSKLSCNDSSVLGNVVKDNDEVLLYRMYPSGQEEELCFSEDHSGVFLTTCPTATCMMVKHCECQTWKISRRPQRIRSTAHSVTNAMVMTSARTSTTHAPSARIYPVRPSLS